MLCRPTQNSGFVTFLNYGQNRSEEDSVFTLAHELGHSLGAVHDEAVEDKVKVTNCNFAKLCKSNLQLSPPPQVFLLSGDFAWGILQTPNAQLGFSFMALLCKKS